MNVFKKVAQEYGTTPAEVRKEIANAIDVGYSNPDPKVQEKWRKYFPDGKKPSPEKFIRVIAGAINS